METVTRRQQLEYLVEKCDTWPSTASCIGMTKEDIMFMERGMCHSTPEAAIAHAKAMLVIDPNE